MEYTEDHEERYWIGTNRPSRRVLMAYYSGHDSLPAFRFEELEWIVDRLQAKDRVLGFLLAKACFFPSDGARVQQFLWRVVELIPGLREDRAQELVAEFLHDQVREIAWIEDSKRGWVSAGGGRDPENPLSALKPKDLDFISGFFKIDGP